jgi:hypothetical protein
MPINEIQGVDVKFQVRVLDGSDPTWKEIVCDIDDQAEMDNEVSEVDTKCGTVTGVKEMKGSYSGNAVSNAAPTSSEASYQDVIAWQKAKTLLEFKYFNEASGSIGVGEALFQTGSGRFTNSVLTAATGETMQFSWTFSPTGEIDLTPNS